MRYHPQTDADVQTMLAAIGAASIDDLFGAIPEALRLNRLLNLPAALGEQALTDHMQALAAKNGASNMRASFLGAGMYEHFVPSVVDHILLRGEYLTSYTPYQAEMAQGTLKVIFEFQTLITEILGLDVANASMYDGAHSAAESLLMALRAFPKAKRVLVSQAVHPEYQRVAQTYFQHRPGVLHCAAHPRRRDRPRRFTRDGFVGCGDCAGPKPKRLWLDRGRGGAGRGLPQQRDTACGVF